MTASRGPAQRSPWVTCRRDSASPRLARLPPTRATSTHCADVGSDTAVEQGVGAVEPRACALLAEDGKLAGFEDICLPFCGNGVVEPGETCDDGNVDDVDTCTQLCTTARPLPRAHVDSEPGRIRRTRPTARWPTAVAPGSTLATQFGSTMFNLNNGLYTRYYAPGRRQIPTQC